MSEETSQPASNEGQETQTESTENNPEITYAGKFKSVGDLEKSYLEAQSFIGSGLGGFSGAPDEYSLGEEYEANEHSQLLAEWGKDNQLSNDAYSDLVTKLDEVNSKREESYKAEEAKYKSEQMEALGKDGEARVKNASDWTLANLGQEAADSINQLWGGAKGIETIEKIMKLSQGVAPTATPAQTAPSAEKVQQMRFAKNEHGDRLMSVDPKYAAKVRELESQLR